VEDRAGRTRLTVPVGDNPLREEGGLVFAARIKRTGMLFVANSLTRYSPAGRTWLWMVKFEGNGDLHRSRGLRVSQILPPA